MSRSLQSYILFEVQRELLNEPLGIHGPLLKNIWNIYAALNFLPDIRSVE